MFVGVLLAFLLTRSRGTSSMTLAAVLPAAADIPIYLYWACQAG